MGTRVVFKYDEKVTNLAHLFNIKPNKIRINASTTFPVRSKCRFCMSGAVNYFVQNTPPKWFNPRRIIDMSRHFHKHTKRMCQNFYWIESPKEFTSIIAFSWYPSEKSYNPALHNKRGTIPVNHAVEFLSCGCGRTAWGFEQKDAKITTTKRKARYSYPQKFEDWF